MADVLVNTCKDGNTVHGSDRRMFVEIGTTILTARSCDTVNAAKLLGAEEESREHSRPLSLRECEIFQPIQPQVRSLCIFSVWLVTLCNGGHCSLLDRAWLQ